MRNPATNTDGVIGRESPTKRKVEGNQYLSANDGESPRQHPSGDAAPKKGVEWGDGGREGKNI